MTTTGPDADSVRALLETRYGEIEKPRLDPLDELVLTILSQSTTDANRDRAFEALGDRYPSWDAVRTAPREEIEDVVRVAGLGGQKAAAIQGALERLEQERGQLSLDHLHDLDDAEAIEYLTSFAGVGVKTAACVLCFSLRRPVLPVDTHVARIGKRLGWLPDPCSSEKAHALLERRTNPDDRFVLHMQMITLGRDTCSARRPRCTECALDDVCPKVGVSPSGP